MTFFDTNVLLDLATDDPDHADWSLAQLEAASLQGPLIINDIVYAELSVRYEKIEDVDHFITRAGLRHDALPSEALFLAGKVFLSYRMSRGTRTGVLPDFFVGAHAAVRNMPLVTRDVARYRTYFPRLNLITPSSAVMRLWPRPRLPIGAQSIARRLIESADSVVIIDFLHGRSDLPARLARLSEPDR